MTEQDKASIFDAIIKPFLHPDANSDAPPAARLFGAAIQALVNSSLLAQQDAHIQCGKHERSESRNGQRNGFKPRTIRTSVGELSVNIPQVRNSDEPFQPFIPGFEQGSRIDRSLNLAIAEMYLQGVSTRKVSAVMREICGGQGVSAAYVSRCTAELDEIFEAWRTRPLPPISHLYLDATYTKIRQDNRICDCAVFVAAGIHAETGKRLILGISTGISEAAEHWAAFIQSLLDRGMTRPLGVTSDDHAGLRKALARTLTGVSWQRCQFHFQQNAQAYVTKVAYRKTAAARIRNIFNSCGRDAAMRAAQDTAGLFRRQGQSKLADWLMDNIEECLTFADCPLEVQRRLRTSNIMENINRQLKRRTNVIAIFPSEASLLRIVTAKAMDISDEWEGQSGRIYLAPDKIRQVAESLPAAASRDSKFAA